LPEPDGTPRSVPPKKTGFAGISNELTLLHSIGQIPESAPFARATHCATTNLPNQFSAV
jgi:hypothetical protein